MVRISSAFCFSHARLLWRPSTLGTSFKRSTPGLKCPPKLWWAKEVGPDLHVSGRLTDRQMKYASEGGFKSVVFVDVDRPGTFTLEPLPTPSDIKSISELVGMRTAFIQTTNNGVPDLASVKQFADMCSSLEKPMLLTGNTEKSASFLALLYLAHQRKTGNSDGPQLTSLDIYRAAALMGYDFTDQLSKANIAEVTSEDVISDPPKPDMENTRITEYWPAHRIGKNWYTAGQIRKQDLPILEKAGFKSLINMRMGVEYGNQPSQEPVTLLNIKDSLSTYDDRNIPTRLNTKLLEDNRIYPEIAATYVGRKSPVNFETINEDEFGDVIGYNEEIEREYVEKNSMLSYKHMPFPLPTKDAYNRDLFEQFKDDLVSADKDGPVLLHCRIGKRVAYFGILALAIKEGRSLQWAKQRSIEMGHEVSEEARPDVYNLYTAFLKSE